MFHRETSSAEGVSEALASVHSLLLLLQEKLLMLLLHLKLVPAAGEASGFKGKIHKLSPCFRQEAAPTLEQTERET